MRLFGAFVLACVGAVGPVALGSEAAQRSVEQAPAELGQVHFPVSCGPAVQQRFDRAVAMLHSFWYDEAEREFAAASRIDPNCAMPYWGIAMTYYHPLWEQPGPESLKKGGEAVRKARSLRAKTERERDYIEALALFYRDWEKTDHRTRALAYERAMERLHRRYPQDREAEIFYALAILGSASPADKTYANQKKAGAMLEKLFAEFPNHPGVAHYLIHAYDYPELARQALPAARRYAEIAPVVPHARHMPSHIFTRLGLWEESIRTNLVSSAAAREHARKVHPGAAFFEELHAMDYLAYAYLQLGQDREAKRVLDRLRQIRKVEPRADFAAAYAFAAIPVRYALERRQWSEAASLPLHPRDFEWSRHPWAEAVLHFGRALGAARSGDTAAARGELANLERLQRQTAESGQSYWADQVEIQRLSAAAWLEFAEGRKEPALELMRSAARLDDATEKHPVTPGAVIPTRELLGEMLLLLGRPAEALAEFERSLRAAPNRYNALYGAARAAELAGEGEKAERFYAQLRKLRGNGSPDGEPREPAAPVAARPHSPPAAVGH